MFGIQHLQHQYNQQTVFEVKNWQAKQGDSWLLLGNSGSGKTTLLHILAGLLKPTQGKVILAEQEITQYSPTQMDRFRARNIGLIFQRTHLISTLSVQKNLQLTQWTAGLKQDKNRILTVTEQLNITHCLRKRPSQLSGGEAQRVSVARAVLNQPKIILADEPTASLDDVNAQQVISLLKTQAQQYNATLVIATHDLRVKTAFEHCFQL
jgi:putative ABC transport system ATP-binding protein